MIELILTLALVGFLLWLLLTYVPMPAPFKTIILVIVVIAAILWVLNGLGVYNSRMFRF